MKIAGLAAFMGMSVLSLMVQSAPASADTDCKALVAASPFGPDDQTGATNRVTAAVTKAAAAEIQTGVVTPMAFNLTDSVPLFGWPAAHVMEIGQRNSMYAWSRCCDSAGRGPTSDSTSTT